MKVNQIVSEHKKGVRAMKYATKTKGAVPVYGPESKDAKLKPVKPTGTVSESEVTLKPMPGAQEVDIDGKAVGTATTPAAATAIADLAKKGEFTPAGDGSTPQTTPETVGEPDAHDGAGEPVGGDATDNWVSEIDQPLNDDMGDKPYFVDMSSGKPMIKSGNGLTPVVPSKMWTQLNPEVVAKASSQGYRQINISVNGQTLQGLEGGGKVIVSPSDFATMSSVKEIQSPYPSRNPGTPAADAAAQAATQPPQQHQSVMPSRNESLDRIRFLSGLK